DPLLLVLLLAGFGAALFFVSLQASKFYAMREAVPLMVRLQSGILDSAAHVVRHDGLTQEQSAAPAFVLSEADKQRQLANAKRQLDQVGSLLAIPRRSEESDDSYAQRLESFMAPLRARNPGLGVPLG